MFTYNIYNCIFQMNNIILVIIINNYQYTNNTINLEDKHIYTMYIIHIYIYIYIYILYTSNNINT